MSRYTIPCLLSALLVSTAAVAQDFTVSVPNKVKKRIGRLLPERSNANMAFVSESYASGVTFSGSGTARIIFLREGAGYQNSLGYFTYTENIDGSITVNTADLLIQNASQPSPVDAGDGFDLRDGGGSIRTFTAGEKLGFFVIADGNRQATSIVSGWTYNFSDSDGKVPSGDPEVNKDRGRGLYTSVSSINREVLDGQPDKARHMVMIEMPGQSGFLGGDDYLMCAFEDLNRTGNSDDDFNDLVFVLEVTPYSSISGTPIFRYEPGDPDSDGVKGLNDQFPNDADRATLERVPSTGMNVIAFEDNYPALGDKDYNDAVIGYYFEIARNANGDVKDIMMTVALLARGAAYDHSFGLHIPGLPLAASGTIDIERFVSGSTTSVTATQQTVQGIIALGTRRVENIIDSTRTLLPPLSGQTFSNTLSDVATQPAGLARMKMTFDVAVPDALLGSAPFDPFLYVDNPNYANTRIDIHLPGKRSFTDRREDLPTELGNGAFVAGNDFPWALEAPNGWRFPREVIDIENAYLLFSSWRASNGSLNLDWYESDNITVNLVGDPTSSILPSQIWTLGFTQ